MYNVFKALSALINVIHNNAIWQDKIACMYQKSKDVFSSIEKRKINRAVKLNFEYGLLV